MTDDHRPSAHGGDWYSFQEKRGFLPLDFSANVSPLGLPESARTAAGRALYESARYPDPECRALRKAIAQEYGVPAEWIFCGNGAADIIYRAAYAARPRRALLLAPCFEEYERALRSAGAEVDFYFPDADRFTIRDASRFLELVHPDTDMIILGEPNNPTGLCTDREVLAQIADFCESRGVRLVLDECFMDFVEDSEGRSWIHRWSSLSEEIHYRNVCVLRAFTKFYGMAGLRLGWCVIPDLDFLRKVQLAGPPWAVSCAAQAAGIAALKEHGYREELRALVARERPRLAEGLERLGFFVLPGEANFLAFYVPAGLYPGNTDLTKKRAADSMRKKQINLDELLRSYGIMIRDLRSFRGLGSGWYRTAVRTKEENERLLNALSEIFEVNL